MLLRFGRQQDYARRKVPLFCFFRSGFGLWHKGYRARVTPAEAL
jgi:hypothetical protein